MTGTLHIIGAGVSGLACAVVAAQKQQPVVLYEASKRAGGRCRSFKDSEMEMTLDNGSHVILAGNPAVYEYLDIIGSSNELIAISESGEIPFVDIEEGKQWVIYPNKGSIPWFLLSPYRRPPETRLSDFTRSLGLIWGAAGKAVSEVLSRTGSAWPRFWEPISTAVMNTAPDKASAQLLGAALKRSLLAARGGLRAYVPRTSLAQTFVEPALDHLQKMKIPVLFDSPIVGIEGTIKADRLIFRNCSVELAAGDHVVLAAPPWAPVVKPFLPAEFTPAPSPIVNGHFLLPKEIKLPATGMTGVIGGRAHWIFTHSQMVSATVSADHALAQMDHSKISEVLWRDIQKCFEWSAHPIPPHRIIVERRATPIQDPDFERLRPGTATSLSNVFLAGDWTDTSLPCTLESAVLSGFRAAQTAFNTA